MYSLKKQVHKSRLLNTVEWKDLDGETIKIINQFGNVVFNRNLNLDKLISVNLSSLSSGVYTVQVILRNGNIINKKCIKI